MKMYRSATFKYLTILIIVEVVLYLLYRYNQPLCEPCLDSQECPPCISDEQRIITWFGVIAFIFTLIAFISERTNDRH
jgi:hypothetical protein